MFGAKLFGIAAVVIALIALAPAPNQSWLLLAGLVPTLSFIVGGALFLVNLVRAMVLKA